MGSGDRPESQSAPHRFEVTLNVNADDIDNRLLSGDLDVDIATLGVQPAAQSRVLQDPNLKANADNPLTTRLQYTTINSTVPPLDNIECRKAIKYAMDRNYETAYGGEFAGGEMATTLLPPIIGGHTDFDLYPTVHTTRATLTRPRVSLVRISRPEVSRSSLPTGKTHSFNPVSRSYTVFRSPGSPCEVTTPVGLYSIR